MLLWHLESHLTSSCSSHDPSRHDPPSVLARSSVSPDTPPVPITPPLQPAHGDLHPEAEADQHYQPVRLALELTPKYRDDPVLKDRAKMFRQYGFDLAKSNSMPLDREVPDSRPEDCKKLSYPSGMPKVSVIIIFYNEALSTLLRNVVSVLNRSPPELLGEIVLVDDNSTLPQLELLGSHLAKLPKKVTTRSPNALFPRCCTPRRYTHERCTPWPRTPAPWNRPAP